MNNDEKSKKVITMIDDLYGNAGMAVVNLIMDYMSDDNWGHLYDRLERDGTFKEPEDDTDPTLKAAIEYVHQTIDAPTIAIIRAKIDKNYEMHLNPAYGIDTSRVEELLNEYGETYLDAPEEWWEQFGDIDDILLKL